MRAFVRSFILFLQNRSLLVMDFKFLWSEIFWDFLHQASLLKFLKVMGGGYRFSKNKSGRISSKIGVFAFVRFLKFE